ncbi:hypothetical protein TNIN_227611, partial [Trichonephila inaurata madagascariensis]
RTWITNEEESGEIDGSGGPATGSGNIDATEEIAESDGTDQSRIWIHRESGITRRPGGHSEFKNSVAKVSADNSEPSKIAADPASGASSGYVTSTKFRDPIQTGGTPQFGKSVAQSNTRVSTNNSNPSKLAADAVSRASSKYCNIRYNSKPSVIAAEATSGATSGYVTSRGTNKFRYSMQSGGTPEFGKSIAQSNTRVSADNSKPSNTAANAASGASSGYVTSEGTNKFRYSMQSGRTPEFGKSVAQSNTRVSADTKV